MALTIDKNGFFKEIKELLLVNDNKINQKKIYFPILISIGIKFNSIFNEENSPKENSDYKISVIEFFHKENLINKFYLILIKLFEYEENRLDSFCEFNDDLFKSIYVVLTIFAKCSECSKEFGKEICKRDGLIGLFKRIIIENKTKCINGSLSKNHTKLLELVVINLYNIVMFDNDTNKSILQQNKILESLNDYVNCQNEYIKTKLLLFAAYISEEKDTNNFINEISLLNNIIKFLSISLKNTGGKEEFTTDVLLKGIEKLSKNDKNKRILVDLGLLSVLKGILQKDCLKYKQICLSILWNLAFDDRNKMQIGREFLEMIPVLAGVLKETNNKVMNLTQENLSKPKPEIEKDSFYEKGNKNKAGSNDIITSPKSNNNEVDLSKSFLESSSKLDGLLWTLQGNQREKIASPIHIHSIDNTANETHAMISYCHKNREFALKIYNELKAKGYKIWIDMHDITANQNLMEAMAQAVEQSLVVIVCISHCYKNSESCRAEAQYAHEIKKPIIPIIMEEKYRPDGWLGICIAGMQYLNFTGKYSFEESMCLLTKQLNQYRNLRKESDTNKPMIVTDHLHLITDQSQTTETNKIGDWSNQKVIEWFDKIGIKKFKWKSHYTGSELKFLKSISDEKLLEFCQEELEINDLKEIRVLSEELKKL